MTKLKARYTKKCYEYNHGCDAQLFRYYIIYARAADDDKYLECHKCFTKYDSENDTEVTVIFEFSRLIRHDGKFE